MPIQVAIVYHSETGNTKQMAELIREGCESVAGAEAQCFSIHDVDQAYVEGAQVVVFGSPTYEGTCSWQMKKYLDTHGRGLAGKLGSTFASQGWPGGGGASLAEITIIAAMLIHGMLIYTGGITQGMPFIHFGAVSQNAPEEGLYRDRCLKLGENMARKASEIFG